MVQLVSFFASQQATKNVKYKRKAHTVHDANFYAYQSTNLSFKATEDETDLIPYNICINGLLSH